jgi:hypothetical protein
MKRTKATRLKDKGVEDAPGAAGEDDQGRRIFMNRILIIAAMMFALATLSQPAFAYVGPGAGLSLLGALWGLLLALLAAVGFIVGWPVRRWLARRRKANEAAAPRTAPVVQSEPSRPAQSR